jgi:RNA-binding protein YhbY
MSTNIKLSRVNGEQKRMKKSYLEMLNQVQRNVPEKSPLKTLIELNREKRIREVREKILEHTRPRTIKKTGTLIIGVRCKPPILLPLRGYHPYLTTDIRFR